MLNVEFMVTQQTYNTAWFELSLYGYRVVLSGANRNLVGGWACPLAAP